jgi:hypothetical protein
MHPPINLDVIQVTSPCTVPWQSMHGNAQVRFCTQCNLNVYNLSALSRSDAERLLAEREGRLCVNFYRRADGTVITQDCSRIRLAAGRVVRRLSAAGAAVVCLLLAPLGLGAHSDRSAKTSIDVQPKEAACRIAGNVMMIPADVVEIRGKPAMPVLGQMIRPAPPATQPTTAPATQPASE